MDTFLWGALLGAILMEALTLFTVRRANKKLQEDYTGCGDKAGDLKTDKVYCTLPVNHPEHSHRGDLFWKKD